MGDKLPENVVNFTTAKIVYDKRKICQCDDPRYEIDYQNRLVTCMECGAYTDPFDALLCLARKPERMMREIESLLQQRREIANYKPHMVVFRDLERSYRGGKGGRMLPTCPQCGESFRFEDITGWANEKFFPPKKKSDSEEK